MFKWIRKIKLRKRLKILDERKLELEIAIEQDKQPLLGLSGDTVYLFCFYRNLENLEMEYEDIKDEIRAIRKELGKR